MELKENIINQVKKIDSEPFQVEDTTSVPTISNKKLTFGCKGLRFEATVLYIDMRGSTSVLNKHNRKTVAKIHMLYYHAIIAVAKDTGGEIRSFNGDSLLVFYKGTTKESLSNAVKAAMQMKHAITELINSNLKNYTNIDFGIGIDYGKVLATKVGIGGDNETKDLIWIGNNINKSTKISDLCKNPNYIGISHHVYENLLGYVKFGEQSTQWGTKNKVDMWNSHPFQYNDKFERYYTTHWHFEIY